LTTSARLSLSSLRGKAVLLNFWASDCAPCRAEMPSLAGVAHRFASRGLVVVGIAEQDRRSDADRYVRSHDVPFPTVFDGNFEVAARYRVVGTPETFLLDRRHRLVLTLVGPIDSPANAAKLRSALASMLA
jgi:thiol-disulfide isomerase/thioredoxin